MMNKGKRASKEWIMAIVSAVILSLVIRTFLFTPYVVHGESMLPTFKGKELLIVNKFVYELKDPEYNDIIVFHTSEQRDFIKRIIGLPNDEIMIKDGKVFRNGKVVDEPYLAEPINGSMPPTIVPEGKLFVLGDNRNHSRDSRQIGVIDMNEVVGRADVIILPFREFKLLIE